MQHGKAITSRVLYLDFLVIIIIFYNYNNNNYYYYYYHYQQLVKNAYFSSYKGADKKAPPNTPLVHPVAGSEGTIM